MKKIEINSPKNKLILTLVVIILTAVIGVSFAYFSIQVTGNENASSIRALAADLELEFTDGPGITIGDIYPGWSKAKTFSVTNNGTDTAYYDIKMYNVYSTFVRDDLVYTLTGTNGGGSKSETIMPNNDGLIRAKRSIAPGVTQTYTMTIKFKELNDPQDYNQKATYSGIIQIISPYKYTNGATAQDITLRERIMIDNTTAYPDNTRSKYVTRAAGINYANPSDYAYVSGDYYTFEKNVNYTSTAAGNKAIGTGFTFDATSGYFKLSGSATSQTFSTDSIGKYTCNNNSANCYSNPQEVYKILEVSGTTVTKVERYMSKPNTNTWNGLGLYQTSTNTEGGLPTYFFRGHVVNNYVKFAGDVWRIVRINEDGTIRLIKQTNTTSSKFYSARDKAKYVGYMYGIDDDPYANYNPSSIKGVVDNYYTTKLASLSGYLADTGFCGDREIYPNSPTTSTKFYYRPYNRLVTNKTPRFGCLNPSRDLYTTSTASIGNHALTYSIGLITADELAYAGGVYGKLSKYYLDVSAGFWTMTPSYFPNTYAYVFYSYTGGVIAHTTTSGSSYYTRPVINLKADTLTLGGSGSATDPYIINN